ncbi:DNA cytosine methyltransferase [Paenibacillus enshidis]|uniref:DNA (cytosine-5-)-methyltransferase n=1 Tax=Paenibacillus enshidis TaxID=1458439 RepID=A0ABV5AVE4_9BACL
MRQTKKKITSQVSWNFQPVSPESYHEGRNERFHVINNRRYNSHGQRIFRDLQLFSGIGGGSLGFKDALVEYGGETGRFENIIGIDADPGACQNYEAITGSKSVCMDLFSREQFIAFHGVEPPEGWREVTGRDLLAACGYIYPDVIFTSPPCKGFSGLLPERSAKSAKYQALNELTIRGIQLCLNAFQDDLPSLFILENVPRIRTRGKFILKRIEKLLESHGYAVSPQERRVYDAGAFGGLGATRKRFLLVARLTTKVSNFLHLPEAHPLKTIGNVLEQLPLPGDLVAGGPMHKIQKLAFKTALRLALIPAGEDWRSLKRIDYTKLRLFNMDSSVSVDIGNMELNINSENGKTNLYRVQRYDEPAGCVTGSAGPSNGGTCIADPMLKERDSRHPGVYRVVPNNEPSPCITGTRFGSGAPAYSDKRTAKEAMDLLLGCSPRAGTYGVQEWDETGKTVTGSCDVHAGTASVADPRTPNDNERGIWIIISEDGTWHRPLTTYELAMLQGFPTHLQDGRPFQLIGSKKDQKWREWIGNAVPPRAAQAIAEQMMATLMASEQNEFLMTWNEVWVSPVIQSMIYDEPVVSWVH